MTRAGELRRDIGTIKDHFRKPQERVPANPGYDISGLSVPVEVLRALVVALAGGHTLYVRAPGRDFDSLLLRCAELLPPLDDEDAEMLQVLEENDEYAEEQIAPRWFPPFHRLSTLTQFGVDVPGNLRASLFGPPSRPWVPGLCSLSHRGVLHVPDLPRIDPETRRLLWRAWRDTQVPMRGGVRYPADFTLVADGAEWPQEPFSLVLPWEGSESPIGDVADDLRDAIAAAHAAQVDRGQAVPNARTATAAFARMTRSAHDELRLLGEVPAAKLAVVARTVADLDGDREVSPAHVAEAFRLTRGARS